MNLSFPYRITGAGRTAPSANHIRDMMEQLLFTAPGERVNRPEFGAGVLELTFAGASDESVAATQLLIEGALQQWMGEIISIAGVRVELGESTLSIHIRYAVHPENSMQSVEFVRDLR